MSSYNLLHDDFSTLVDKAMASASSKIIDSTKMIENQARRLIDGSPPSLADQLKEFTSAHKHQIASMLSKLIGFTVSAGISYLFLKWLINSMDPTAKEKRKAKEKTELIMKKLGLKNSILNEYEELIAINIILPQDIESSWSDIGGLDHLVSDLRETVIYPLKNNISKYTRSKLVQAPKGMLLFGPPGNAKTMIAKALAKESGAFFINLQISSLFDKWYGESQKRTDAIFSLARKIQPCIIFIDEIDSFMRSRNSDDHECTLMMKTQFMTLWDGLTSNDNNRILIIGATNRPQDVDSAILRRMPALFNIGMPNSFQRVKILKTILKDEILADDVNIEDLSVKAEDFSGSDLKELCRCAAMNRFITNLKENKFLDLNHADLNNKNGEDIVDDVEAVKLRETDFNVAFGKLLVKNLTKNNNNDRLEEIDS